MEIDTQAINEIPDIVPVDLPDTNLSLPERVQNIEAELNINS